MMANVKAGDLIRELDSDGTLRVSSLWGDASETIDFGGVYVNASGNPHIGTIYGGRGFRFEDEGVIWEKVSE